MDKEKIERVLFRFLREHNQCSMPTPQYYIAEQIMTEENLWDKYELFLYDDYFGLLNMEEILDEETFLQVATLGTWHEEDDTILRLWEKPGVVYLYDGCIEFLSSVCRNPDLVEQLKNPPKAE